MRQWFLGGLFVSAGLYLVWWFYPPPDAVGSYLDGFNDSSRKKKMIRDEADQEHDLFNT